MATQIYVNLPVNDLAKSITFFEALGYDFHPEFTDENAGAMVISDTIYVTLVTEPLFKQMTQRDVADTAAVREVAVAVTTESNARVDELVDQAVANGGTTSGEPIDDDYMYSRTFADLDGHLWSFLHMKPQN